MKRVMLGMTTLATLLVSNSLQADVPNVFTDGEPAIAAEVNENFNDLDTRVTALEGISGSDTITINVECNAGGSANNAIAEAASAKHLFVNISGTCNERVVITRSGVSLLSDAATPASINFVETPLSPLHVSLGDVLLPELNGAINLIGASNIIIDNLTITGATAGVAVRYNSSAIVQNSTLTGNVIGLSADSNSTAVLANSQVNNNSLYGAVANNSGTLSLTGGNTIVQTGPKAGNFKNYAIGGFRNSSITISGVNSLEAIGVDNEVLGIYYNSQVRVHRDLLTANGNSSVGYDSQINLRDVNHTGNIAVFTRGALRLQNLSGSTTSGVTVTGNINSSTLAFVTIGSGTTVNGSVTCGLNSSHGSIAGIVTGPITNC